MTNSRTNSGWHLYWGPRRSVNSLTFVTFAALSWTGVSAFCPDASSITRSCGGSGAREMEFGRDSNMPRSMSTFAEVENPARTSSNFVRSPRPVMVESESTRHQRAEIERVAYGSEHVPYGTCNSQLANNTTDHVTERRVQFKGLSTGPNRNRHRTKLRISERGGRIYSSTMPGFGVESDRLRAYRDGVRLAEVETGRKSAESTESERERKRRQHGETLYRNSGAVPESLMQFAGAIHQEERISRKEEIELGELTQEAVRLQQLYDRLKDKLQREPTDNEWCAAAGKINMNAIEQAIQDGFEAKNRLVASNLRIVQSVVNIYLRNGLSAQYNAGDMMQEGILALIRAAEKFEPERGWKFSTYAMYWVRASVKRNQVAQSRPVPVPHRVYENHKRLLRTQRKLELSLNRRPTKRELGDAVGMSELQVERCYNAMQQKFYSLDQEIRNTKKPLRANERNDRLVEIVEARVVDDEFSLNAVSLREAFVETLSRHLTAQEVELLMLRYGLKDCPEHEKVGGQPTIAELSRHLNLTPDKVRRIIKRALKQLKEVDPQEWLVFKEELC